MPLSLLLYLPSSRYFLSGLGYICIHMHFFFLAPIFWPAFMTHANLRVLLWALLAMDNVTVPVLIKRHTAAVRGNMSDISNFNRYCVSLISHRAILWNVP